MAAHENDTEALIPLAGLRARGRSRSPQAIERSITRKVGRAVGDFEMIADGDRIMVCISGGKDSYALLWALQTLARRAPISFELVAINIDQGWPGYDTDRIAAHLASTGVRYQMIKEDYAKKVEELLKPGQTPCSLCSRFRRGVLYRLADELECDKIALGHHADDLIETLVLNMFYAGRLASMPAVLTSDSGEQTVIRPLCYVDEATLREFSEISSFPVVVCGCPSCGLPDQKRQVVKRLLADLESENPGLKGNMLGALGNVRPTHLLDKTLSRR